MGRAAGSIWRLPTWVHSIKWFCTFCRGRFQDLWRVQQKMEDVLAWPGKAVVRPEEWDQRALPMLDTAFVEKKGRSRVNFLLDSKNQELIYDGQQLSEPCFNSLIKSRSGLKALNESQSIFFFKASAGSKWSLALVHGRWLRRCFSALYIVIFDLNLLLPLLQKAHVFFAGVGDFQSPSRRDLMGKEGAKPTVIPCQDNDWSQKPCQVLCSQ